MSKFIPNVIITLTNGTTVLLPYSYLSEISGEINHKNIYERLEKSPIFPVINPKGTYFKTSHILSICIEY